MTGTKYRLKHLGAGDFTIIPDDGDWDNGMFEQFWISKNSVVLMDWLEHYPQVIDQFLLRTQQLPLIQAMGECE